MESLLNKISIVLQAVWRKMRALGYLNLINSNRTALQALKMLMALPLLPSQDIRRGHFIIVDLVTDATIIIENLTGYVLR